MAIVFCGRNLSSYLHTMRKLRTLVLIVFGLFSLVGAYNLSFVDKLLVNKLAGVLQERFIEEGGIYEQNVLTAVETIIEKTNNERTAIFFEALFVALETEEVIEPQEEVFDTEEETQEPIVEDESEEIFSVSVPKYHHTVIGWEDMWIGNFQFSLNYHPVTIEEIELNLNGAILDYHQSLESFELYGQNGQKLKNIPIPSAGDIIVDLDYEIYDGDHLFIKAIAKNQGKDSLWLIQGTFLKDAEVEVVITKARMNNHTLPDDYVNQSNTITPKFDLAPVAVADIKLVTSYAGQPTITAVSNGAVGQHIGYLVVTAAQSNNHRESQSSHADLVLRKINIGGTNIANIELERIGWAGERIALVGAILTDFTDTTADYAGDLILDTSSGETAIYKIYWDVSGTSITLNVNTLTDFIISSDETNGINFAWEKFIPRVGETTLGYILTAE